MLLITTKPRACRACAGIIRQSVTISWVVGKGPYHTACSPIPEDATYKHHPLPPLDRSAEPLEIGAELVPTSSSSPAWQRLIPHAIAGLLLLVALFPANEIGYYRVMRWIVCAAFAHMTVVSYSKNKSSWAWVWGVAAGIYNPIVPVEASREIWSVVNLASIGLIAFDAFGGAKTVARVTREIVDVTRTAFYFILRLALALITIAILLLAFNFVITRLA